MTVLPDMPGAMDRAPARDAALDGPAKPIDAQMFLSREGKAQSLGKLRGLLLQYHGTTDTIGLLAGVPAPETLPFETMDIRLADGGTLHIPAKEVWSCHGAGEECMARGRVPAGNVIAAPPPLGPSACCRSVWASRHVPIPSRPTSTRSGQQPTCASHAHLRLTCPLPSTLAPFV